MENGLRNKKEDNMSLSVESSVLCSHLFPSEIARLTTKSLKLVNIKGKEERHFFL